MDSEIVPRGSLYIKNFPTFTEFKDLSLSEEPAVSALDRFADIFDKLPLPIKLLKNFDPTGGFISSFVDALSEIKAKRNEEKLWKTLYELFKALSILEKNSVSLNPEYFESQVVALTEMYIDRSMNSYQLKKIEIFRNAFIGGVFEYDRDLNEKENIFNIISSLSLEQIHILKFIYDNRFNSNTVDKEMIVRELRLTEPYVQQLCNDLIGKGLLIGNPGPSRIDGYGGYKSYYIGDYLEILIKYIKEPVDPVIFINVKHS